MEKRKRNEEKENSVGEEVGGKERANDRIDGEKRNLEGVKIAPRRLNPDKRAGKMTLDPAPRREKRREMGGKNERRRTR